MLTEGGGINFLHNPKGSKEWPGRGDPDGDCRMIWNADVWDLGGVCDKSNVWPLMWVGPVTSWRRLRSSRICLNSTTRRQVSESIWMLKSASTMFDCNVQSEMRKSWISERNDGCGLGGQMTALVAEVVWWDVIYLQLKTRCSNVVTCGTDSTEAWMVLRW